MIAGLRVVKRKKLIGEDKMPEEYVSELGYRPL